MKLIVHPVNSEFVQQLWPKVEKFIFSALEYSNGEYTAEQLKVLVVRREQILLIGIDEENTIHGAATVQFIDYPNYRVAFITTIGGRLIASVENFEQLVNWCKSCGATKIQGVARKSIERLWKRLFNFENRYSIVEKDI
jgi:hypothetical protein